MAWRAAHRLKSAPTYLRLENRVALLRLASRWPPRLDVQLAQPLRPLRNVLAPQLLAEENVFTREIVFTHAELTGPLASRRNELMPHSTQPWSNSMFGLPPGGGFIVQKLPKRRLISNHCVLVAGQPAAGSADSLDHVLNSWPGNHQAARARAIQNTEVSGRVENAFSCLDSSCRLRL